MNQDIILWELTFLFDKLCLFESSKGQLYH